MMPAIALRGLTVFPSVLIHFDVSREISIQGVGGCHGQRQPGVPWWGRRTSLWRRRRRRTCMLWARCLTVRQILRMPGDKRAGDGGRGEPRTHAGALTRTEPYLEGRGRADPAGRRPTGPAPRRRPCCAQYYEMFQRVYGADANNVAPDLLVNVLASEDPGYMADYIAQNIPMRNSDKQAILEELRPVRRLEKLYRLLRREVEMLQPGAARSRAKAREQMSAQSAGLLPAGAAEGHPERAGRRRGRRRDRGLPPEDR